MIWKLEEHRKSKFRLQHSKQNIFTEKPCLRSCYQLLNRVFFEQKGSNEHLVRTLHVGLKCSRRRFMEKPGRGPALNVTRLPTKIRWITYILPLSIVPMMLSVTLHNPRVSASTIPFTPTIFTKEMSWPLSCCAPNTLSFFFFFLEN